MTVQELIDFMGDNNIPDETIIYIYSESGRKFEESSDITIIDDNDLNPGNISVCIYGE